MSFRSWGPDDIYEAPCHWCGEDVEFFSIDKGQFCPGCGRWLQNPRNRASCSQWCASSDKCPGASG